MRLEPDALLIETVVSLRSANYQIYTQLVAALHAHSVRAAENCVAAAPEYLQNMQGRAQQARILLDLFENAAAHADKLRQIRKTKTP